MPPTDPGFPLELVVAAVAAVVIAVVIVAARRSIAFARAELVAAERRAAKERERAEVLDKDLRAVRARTEPEVRAERLVLDGLARSIRDLGACATRDDVAASMGRAVASTLAPRQWMVFLSADDEGREFVVAASGAAEGVRVWKPGARLSGQVGLAGLAVRRRATVDHRDLESEPPIVREQVQKTEPADFEIEVAVPVLVGDRVTAIVAFGRPEPLLGVARTAAEAMAHAASTVLRGLAARERAERFANQDTLTGVGNRSWFNATAAEELYRIRQEGGIASLVVVGVDHYQHYLRRNGHQAGDKLVRGVAQVLRSLAGDGDLLARWSGDEFVVFLPGSDLPTAWAFAARARRAVSNVEWPFAASQPSGRVTVCAGIAAYPVTGDTLEQMIESASGTLAEARLAGGDTTGSVVIEPAAARSIGKAAV